VTLTYGSAAAGAPEHVIDLSLNPRPDRPASVMPKADSIFVVGDVHGMLTPLRTMLRNAGVINPADGWTAGRAHLVFLGDLLDRGPDVVPLLWFIYRLERDARKQGGSVDVVLGNHEIMVWTHDLRYVAARERQLALLHGKDYPELFDPDQTVLGRWLASKPGMIQIGDVVMAHGGITPAFAQIPIPRFNEALYRYIYEPMFADLLADSAVTARFDSTELANRQAFFYADQSPFWYRGYVQSDSTEAQLDSLLASYRATLHVVGHTPTPAITSRYHGKLIDTNVLAFGSEMLLLVRANDGSYRRYRIDTHGKPTDL
jgi:hypothetical protein